jgi:hypothetical protein
MRMENTEQKDSTKYQEESVYNESYNITRNNQTISVDVEIETGYNGDAWICQVRWGGEEFLLTDEEENDILSFVIDNLEPYSESDEDE